MIQHNIYVLTVCFVCNTYNTMEAANVFVDHGTNILPHAGIVQTDNLT